MSEEREPTTQELVDEAVGKSYYALRAISRLHEADLVHGPIVVSRLKVARSELLTAVTYITNMIDN